MSDTILDVAVGLQLTADSAWTDITSLAYQREGTSPPVTITRGRPDESAQANPSACSMQWNNRDGRFTPGNPSGPYYGQLGRNTPVRVSVPDDTTYLRIEDDDYSYASMPGSGVLPSGSVSLDIRADMLLTDWQPGAIAGWWGSAERAWCLLLNSTGTVTFAWTTDGTLGTESTVESSVPLPLGAGVLRVTFVYSPLAVTFYTAPTGQIDGSSWTQLGTAFSSSATTSIFASTAALYVGCVPQVETDFNTDGINGQVYDFEVRSGVGGSKKCQAAFTSQSAGATSWTDAQSNTWTVSGTAELSDRSYRYHGECSALPVQWDPTGTDIWVPVQAGGILRRLQQGNAPILSAMRRAVLAFTGAYVPAAYWPMEDLAGAVQFAPGLPGGDPMTTGTGATLSADSTFACSASLPEIGGATFYGTVTYDGTWTDNVVRFLFTETAGTITSSNTVLLAIFTTGTIYQLNLFYDTGGELGLAGYNAAGTQLFTTGGIAFAIDGEQLRVSVNIKADGSDVTAEIETLTPGATSASTYSDTIAGTVGAVQRVVVNPYGAALGSSVTGHLYVQPKWESLFDLESYTAADGSLTGPFRAWAGEPAGDRFARLCTENSITPRIYGPPDASVTMGAQAIDTLANVLQACEDADHGQIYEPRANLGLGYRTLASLCGQNPRLTLSYTAAELGDGQNGIGVTYDDQYTVNDWLITNNNGSSYELTLDDGSQMSISPPPEGAGDYQSSKTLYLYNDGQLPDAAGWMLHVSTCAEPRYPVLPVNLYRSQLAALIYDIQDLELGDYLAVSGPPGWLPPGNVKQIIAGTTEELGGYWHRLRWAAVPESPYEVMVASDPVYGHAGTSGSILAAAATSAATTLWVATEDGYVPWTTSGGDFPFCIGAAGEQIEVTAISNPTGSATSPAAYTTLGITATLAEGTYVLQWQVTLSGTLSSSDVNNFQVSVGATYKGSSVNPDVAGTYVQAPLTVVVPSGGATIDVQSSATRATTGAVYTGTILSIQELTVTRSVNGVVKAQAAGAAVSLFYPPVAALVAAPAAA
jgi:hypothetical protein